MIKIQALMKSPIGPLYLVASETGLCGVHWTKQPFPMLTTSGEAAKLAPVLILRQALRELAEYFAGKRKTFLIPLDFSGTEFQKNVWAQLQKIPYGQTRSYKQVARLIRNEKAVRAVGTANGRNPLSIVIPCHRVIAASGELGGYGGGCRRKTMLLDLEKSR